MKFQMRELIGTSTITARLGASPDAAGRLNDKDAGKLVVLAGDSRYDLAPVGSEIEGRIVSVDTATSDGFSTGSVQEDGFMYVILDGLQATPGVGAIAIKDYVLVGTPIAKGAVQPDAGPRVVKATDQALAKSSHNAWRVVAFLTGNGGVGTFATIKKVG